MTALSDNMGATLQIVPEASLTKKQDAAIRAGLCECFPADKEIFSSTRSWHSTYPTWSIIVERNNRIIAHTGVVEREILIGAKRVRAAGIQNVFVLPAHRKTGLFHQLMTTAIQESLRRNLDLALLFCSHDLAKTYTRLNWLPMLNRKITRTDQTGHPLPLPAKNTTMFHPLHLKDIPSGDIHLLGNDW